MPVNIYKRIYFSQKKRREINFHQIFVSRPLACLAWFPACD
jgi:hypothetical protein